ncbi:ABC-2 type transport system ATP-binding protein [Texcoconibacillus texcoconensis]|uniref:ABC-2 type transport system ATP-binding protein n=2 Tax=Texcoconibacillus texcoconensis TaxID=1095777 RepID=A0A840QPI9_9BACI|nr:ABC transporter ATP-binding protein [Texcoconibacillus texcoconensis]MBB5173285.1 ABC-2 type transport system ATP-binding protein [Texcoconibacillus texcoconensis]
MMKVERITKVVQKETILNDINFNVELGHIIGVVGRNGVGKTTLLRTMVGILLPTNGDVMIDEASIFKQPAKKQDVMFVPDSPEALKQYSTNEIVRIYEATYHRFDRNYFYELMERFSLPTVKKITHYSKGMKALFSLILAFSTRAKYILLDEPTDGLDVIVKKQILQFLIEEVADGDVSIIISSHRLDELEFMCDEIILMKDGSIESHYELAEMKTMYKKVQVVFEKEMPADVTKHVNILNQTGRVYTLIIDQSDEEAEQVIANHQPVLFEELPISLEDLFVTKLGGDSDVS